MRNLAARVLVPEVMDDPALETDRHHAALRALTRINFLSASARILWSPIRQLARELKTDRLRVLDIATGAGDIPLALWRKAQQAGLKLDVHGVDISERALDFARRRSAACKAPIQFSRLDVFQDSVPSGFDVVVCSLFLHHLSSEQAARLLPAMASAAKHLVAISDLRRSHSGLALAYLASRTLTRCDVVHTDALLSVRAAFSVPEMQALAEAAGLDNAQVVRRWPCRFLLTWRKR